MGPELVCLLGFAAVFLLIALRVPIAISLSIVGVIGFGLLEGFDRVGFVLGVAPFSAVSNYTLSILPLFILMSVFANRGGLSRSLYEGVYALIGHWRGGLAMATVIGCAGFGAICGSSLATAATMGKISIPEMLRRGYDERLAAGVVAASGTIGVLVPPSVIVIIYAYMTESSIGDLIVAAIIPAAITVAIQLLVIRILTSWKPAWAPVAAKVKNRERLKHLLGSWPMFSLVVLVIGGIYLGWFSPTEAAAVGAFGALLLGVVRKKMRFGDMLKSLEEAAVTCGMIFFIIIGANIFNYFIEVSGVAQSLVIMLQELAWHRYVIIAIILLIYLLLGCVMDSLSLILVLTPFFYPIVDTLGFDVVWFGIITVIVVEIGLITPPIGMNVFVLKRVTPNLRLSSVFVGIVPFLVSDLFRLLLFILFPQLILWLPHTMR